MLPKKHFQSSETQTTIKHQDQESQTTAQNLNEKITKETQVRIQNFLTNYQKSGFSNDWL